MPSTSVHLRRAGLWLAAVLAILMPTVALAQGQVEIAKPWQIYFMEPASPIMEQIEAFNYWIQIIIVAITVFVMALLGWCIIRFNSRRNPVPSRTSHNTVIEVLWTVVPVLILVGIAIPSFALLFAQYDPARAIEDYNPQTTPQLTVKATASAYSWQYDYPDANITLYSSWLGRDVEPRMLAVDQPLVVPVDTVVWVQVTATDVLHAFAMSAMGLKVDAVPGRLIETWFRAEREGMFYGQCSELCGVGHSEMPIGLRVVSREIYDAWQAAAATSLRTANALLPPL